MQRSSDSIAKLASALAKAQIELVNPEKSLIGTINMGEGQEGRSFNYASLASGLDIVRKTLGQYEIATVQTTAIDEATRMVRLTTTLAHSSGEWIASDWPVCAVAETAMPRRMGAALTYARRYALFTLVGIAGEDDLDAPDLQAPNNQTSGQTAVSGRLNGKTNGMAAGGETDQPNGGRSPPQRRGKVYGAPPHKTLGPAESAALCEHLLAELEKLGSADDLALWAKQRLSAKNKLTTGDAERIEGAFAARLATFAVPEPDQRAEPSEDPSSPPAARPPKRPRPYRSASPWTRPSHEAQQGIDKSTLALPEPRRLRDRVHLKYVVQQACLVCGRTPCDPHHLRFTQNPALGRKVSDEFTVPLCRGHHRELHRHGDEAAWWDKRGIDPTPEARKLWLETHPLPAIAPPLSERTKSA